MKKILILLLVMIQSICISSKTLDELSQRFSRFDANYQSDGILLDFSISDGLVCDSTIIYRSYNEIEIPVDLYKQPISKNVIYSKDNFIDREFADNVDYFYRAVGYYNGEPWAISKNVTVQVPNVFLTANEINYKDVRIDIDKINYLLKLVAYESEVIKKYPIAMGESPFTRKVMRDKVSSPEGLYEVVYILKNASNYKAFDINYPNTVDRVRYELSKDLELIAPQESIGGDIQIHGMGINTNWTFGSFSLRNSDIDEIIESQLIRRGSKVFITGYEIKPVDIPYLDRFWTKGEIKIIQNKLLEQGYDIIPDGVMGPNSRKVLGDYQFKNGLRVTCDLDRNTCRKIGYIPYDVKP